MIYFRNHSEWDERSEGQVPSIEENQLTAPNTATHRFLCDVHRPTGRRASATGEDSGECGDLTASPPPDGEAEKGSGVEARGRDLGAISKTGKR